MKPNLLSQGESRSVSAAFTLIELLVVIAIIAILAALLLPALQLAKQTSYGAHDANSMKQVQTAWHMYASDARDSLPGNDWPAEKAWIPGTTALAQNWVSGWEQLGIVGTPDNTNTTLLTDPHYAQLGAYIINPKIYICVASKSLCAGYDLPLCRDISMSVWMGSSANQPSAQDTNDGYQLFTKQSQIAGQTPEGRPFGTADAIVFVDEKDDSIDDGEFLIQETSGGTSEIANMPAAYHAGAGLVSFADGHAEIHKWYSPVVLTPPQQAGVVVWQARPDNFRSIPSGDPKTELCDLGWLQKHATYSVQPFKDQETAIPYAKPGN
jgi:prepilin-type N-terminal cleavage/methylation domain-containing protein